MPFYTFKCRTCGLEKEEMRSMGDFKEPLCPICCNNPEIEGKDKKMKKIISTSINSKMGDKDGFYDFSSKNFQEGKSEGNNFKITEAFHDRWMKETGYGEKFHAENRKGLGSEPKHWEMTDEDWANGDDE